MQESHLWSWVRDLRKEKSNRASFHLFESSRYQRSHKPQPAAQYSTRITRSGTCENEYDTSFFPFLNQKLFKTFFLFCFSLPFIYCKCWMYGPPLHGISTGAFWQCSIEQIKRL